MIPVFNNISPVFSTKLDLARAVAAALVVLSHLRGGFFASYDHLISNSHNAINYGLFLLTRLGNEAVIIFFVLSGYLVGGSILAAWMSGNPNWMKYLINRITRMWTVLLPALVIGALFDYYVNPEFGNTRSCTFDFREFYWKYVFFTNNCSFHVWDKCTVMESC